MPRRYIHFDESSRDETARFKYPERTPVMEYCCDEIAEHRDAPPGRIRDLRRR